MVALTQGFQQPGSGAVGIDEPELEFFTELFPNPILSVLIFDFNASRQQIIETSLYGALRKSYGLYEGKLNVSGNMQHEIDFSYLSAGNYVIRHNNLEESSDNSIKFQKIY